MSGVEPAVWASLAGSAASVASNTKGPQPGAAGGGAGGGGSAPSLQPSINRARAQGGDMDNEKFMKLLQMLAQSRGGGGYGR